jgi:glycosyltransferase involved in cell wall biosynthesis
MNFLFHTLSLTSSGGSRVIINLSNYLAENGHNIAIIIDRNRIAFPVHKNVKIYHLTNFKLKDVTPAYQGDTDHFQSHIKKKTEKKSKQKKQKLRDKYPAIQSINEWKKYLLKLLTFPSKYFVMKEFLSDFKPDKIASHNMYYFLEHYFFYPRDRMSVVLHNSPNEVFINRGVKHLLPMTAYFGQRKCISVSEGVLDEMKDLMPFISADSRTIYNPFDFEEIRKRSEESIDKFHQDNRYVISVSSLAPGKRVERIIEAFSLLEDKELKLCILGVGEEENKLKDLVIAKGIQERVRFEGFIENPMPYMKHAECLVLASDSEGLPTVLIEALVCGTPVVSTNCKTGPSEILTGEHKKLLVDIDGVEEHEIYENLSEAITIALTERVDDSSILKFSKPTITNEWEI